jgi:hypothetical protein
LNDGNGGKRINEEESLSLAKILPIGKSFLSITLTSLY